MNIKLPLIKLSKLSQRLFFLLLLIPVSAFAQQYQLVDLGLDVTPKDINNAGTVVGSRPTGPYSTIAFRYSLSAGFQNLVDGVVANAINDSDQITGNTASGAFFFNTTMNYIGDSFTGFGINELGQISGGKTGVNPFRVSPLPVNPAVYDSSTGNWKVLDIAKVYPRSSIDGVYADLYSLEDINDLGFTVGTRRKLGISNANIPFVLSPDSNAVTALPIPYAASASVNAINNQNMLVGATGRNSVPTAYSHAYRYNYTTGDFIDLGTLNGGLTSRATDINELNQVVGSSWLVVVNTSASDPSKYHAFIWENGLMTDLNSYVDANSGWILTAARAINDNGDIVGTGLFNGQVHGFLLTSNQTIPVPVEPPPVALAPVAVATVSITNRRRSLTVTYDATRSYDSDGTIASFEWDFGDGTNSVDINPTHTYAVAGIYSTTLTVTDNQSLTNSVQLVVKVGSNKRRK